MTPHDQLQTLQDALDQLREGRIDAAAFTGLATRQTVLAAALPGRFREVLDQMCNRLESSALFSEESCSYSQRDLWDAMQSWIDKAGALPALHDSSHVP